MKLLESKVKDYIDELMKGKDGPIEGSTLIYEDMNDTIEIETEKELE